MRGRMVSKNIAEKKDSKLRKAAMITLTQCLGVTKKESVLIVMDKNTREIAHALFYTALGLARRVSLVEIPVGKVNGEEPPKSIAAEMKKFDIVLCPTTKSLTHTNAVSAARKKKARIATLPGITNDIFIRGMNADYKKIAARTTKLWSKIRKGDIIRVTTEKGTDIILKVGVRANANSPEGFILNKGESNNLPAGEAFLVPAFRSANGVFVVDASMAGVGRLKKPIKITVKDGFAVKIEGGSEAEKLRKALSPHGKNAYNIAELGIGTNDQAKISGKILEDEKVLGTAHIALGNSKGMGGPTYAGCHLDGVFMKPTITVGKNIIIKRGKLIN